MIKYIIFALFIYKIYTTMPVLDITNRTVEEALKLAEEQAAKAEQGAKAAKAAKKAEKESGNKDADPKAPVDPKEPTDA